jgi:hypothetical protein
MINPTEFVTAVEKMRAFHGENVPLDLLVPVPMSADAAAAVEACGVCVVVSPWLAPGTAYLMPHKEAAKFLGELGPWE